MRVEDRGLSIVRHLTKMIWKPSLFAFLGLLFSGRTLNSLAFGGSNHISEESDFLRGPWQSSVNNKLEALHKVLYYISKRIEQMNPDATFGITLTEANLEALLKNKNSAFLDYSEITILRELLKVSNSIRETLLKVISPQNDDVAILHRTLNNPKLWINQIDWKNGTLGVKPTADFIYSDAAELIMQGTPTEKQSDHCLANIVRSKRGKYCFGTPINCIRILIDKKRARGYPLTHRLLILQVLRAINCEDRRILFPNLTHLYCSAIWKDLIDVEATGFPSSSQDLMMEQILLCGMEGFLEFLDKRYEELILNWSHPSGCFSGFGFKKYRTRRTTTKTEYGCDSHATGVAAAVLSLFLRENVEYGLIRK